MSKKVKKAPDNVKTVIKNAMKACQKKGLEISSGIWGTAMDEDLGYFVPSGKLVCALGALLIHKDGSVKYDKVRGKRELSDLEEGEVAAYILGVDQEWVTCFINGFDGDDPNSNGDEIGWDNTKEDYKKRASAWVLENRRAFLLGQNLAKEFKA